MPKVSVLIATYNRARLIGRAIESVRTQSFQDFEVIIVDDASKDETEHVLAEWRAKDPRIIYVKNEMNLGIAAASNRGLEIARGEYVAILDDDDAWADTEKIETQVNFLDTHSDYVGCGGGVIVVDGDGKELFRYLKPETDKAIREKMLFANPMANSTTLFRKSAAARAGNYDTSSRYSSDRDFWLKMGTLGKLCNFPRYFAFYAMSGENTSITRLRPHLKASLHFMKRYRTNYPHYPQALVINTLQYWYAFLPQALRLRFHRTLSSLKRRLVG